MSVMKTPTRDVIPRKELLKQKELFATAYVKHAFNGKQAAMELGFPEKRATSIAGRMLKEPLVIELINEVVNDKLLDLNVDAKWVLEKAALLASLEVGWGGHLPW